MPNDLLLSALLLLLTVGSYVTGRMVYNRNHHQPLLNPLLVALFPILGLLYLSGTGFDTYYKATTPVHFLLGPATVALAIPLYRYSSNIRANAGAIILTLLTGAFIATASATLIAMALGMEGKVLTSIIPKTITSPIAMEVARLTGGYITLTAGVVIFTGVISAVTCPFVFKWLGIHDHRIQGFTLGLTGHGVGTARAFDISPLAGAYASLAMSLAGLLLALVLPFLVNSLATIA